MAHSLSFLLGSDAAQQRIASRKPNFVVHAEVAGNEVVTAGFQELDAESLESAHDIASAWCANGMAMSAAVRRVFPDGSLGRVVGRIHDSTDAMECVA